MTEVKAWAFAIGNFHLIPTKDDQRAMEIIKGLEGLYGVKPEFPRGTLLIFKTENHAKRAKNLLESYGIKTGAHIGECFIPAEYAKT